MAKQKESFFWTSYSDLMTSLFFVMMVLFVLVIVLLHKRMEATETQLQEIKKVEASTKKLAQSAYFDFRPEYKKYVLKTKVTYVKGESSLNKINTPNPQKTLDELEESGRVICDFLDRHKDYQYVLIIEGQASRDNYPYNYELSYERALALIKFWAIEKGLNFGSNCEILISGSGDGKIDTHSMRETHESDNQRFLIHIIPKNIFAENETH